jgi:predicted Fe-Mo cluster-binding NifX family protein
MNVCIPVEKDQGLDSHVHDHFGSAPMFLLVDTEKLTCETVANRHADHGAGVCHAAGALRGKPVDAVVTSAIGMGALGKLEAAGYKVFQARPKTVRETVEALKSGSLAVFGREASCGCGHGQHGQHGERRGCK